MTSDSEESEANALEPDKALKQKFAEEYRRPGSLKERRLWLSENRNTSCTHCTRKKLKCEPNPDYARCETCKSHKSTGGCSRVAEERKSRVMKKLNIDEDTFEKLLQATYGSTRNVQGEVATAGKTIGKKAKGSELEKSSVNKARLNMSNTSQVHTGGSNQGNAATASKNQPPARTKRYVPVVEVRTVRRIGERDTSNAASPERTVHVIRKRKNDSVTRTQSNLEEKKQVMINKSKSGRKAGEDDSEDSDVAPAPPRQKKPMLQIMIEDDESDEDDQREQRHRNEESDHEDENERQLDSRASRRDEEFEAPIKAPFDPPLNDSPFIRLHFVKRSLEVGMQSLSSHHPLWQTLRDSVDEIGDIATLELDRLRMMRRHDRGPEGKTGDPGRARGSEEFDGRDADDQSQRKRRRIIRPPNRFEVPESSGKKRMPKHR